VSQIFADREVLDNLVYRENPREVPAHQVFFASWLSLFESAQEIMQIFWRSRGKDFREGLDRIPFVYLLHLLRHRNTI